MLYTSLPLYFSIAKQVLNIKCATKFVEKKTCFFYIVWYTVPFIPWISIPTNGSESVSHSVLSNSLKSNCLQTQGL